MRPLRLSSPDWLSMANGQSGFKFLRSQVLQAGVKGKRMFDAAGKRRLIAECRQPDVPVSRMVLKVSFNANQLSDCLCASKQREVGPPPLAIAKD